MVRRFSRPRPSRQNDTDSDMAENIHFATEIRNAAKTARFRRLFFEKSRPIQVDDILWFICFGLTMLILDVPNTVLFHHKVDWHVSNYIFKQK
uniref:Uncharacterized protein n=1 Tax=Panagrolaimus sp. ES5 TaxID=591445 RepID=A0AC34FGY3_9BILA